MVRIFDHPNIMALTEAQPLDLNLHILQVYSSIEFLCIPHSSVLSLGQCSAVLF